MGQIEQLYGRRPAEPFGGPALPTGGPAAREGDRPGERAAEAHAPGGTTRS
jgi:hypothetical protein